MKLAIAAFAAIAVTMPAYSADHAGKAVYDKSCQNCHGDNGAGSATADAFYKIKIPRLNSNPVKMLTNPEMKNIIQGGKGRMEPVKMGRPTSPHRQDLTDQQIEDVIAYVRTFPKAN